MIFRVFVIFILSQVRWGHRVILVVMKCAMMMAIVRNFAQRGIVRKVTVVHQGSVREIWLHPYVQPVVICLAEKIPNAWGLRVQLFVRITVRVTASVENILNAQRYRAVVVSAGR